MSTREVPFLLKRLSFHPIRAAVLLAAVGSGACGGDAPHLPLIPPPAPPPPPRPPATLTPIPDQSLRTGHEVSLDLDLYFTDPDGDALRYAATWPASGVVPITASLAGSMLTIIGVAGGTTTVTVTASDRGGLSATQRFAVAVSQSNRPPTALVEPEAVAMFVGDEAVGLVRSFFADPDGDVLSFAAESSAPAVASVAMERDILTITGVSAGAATVTVTAEDPGGLSGTVDMPVTVYRKETGTFRDDFASSASLSDWEVLNAGAVVDDDLLRLTNEAGGPGVAVHDFGHALTSWTVRARLGRAEADGRASLWWATGDDRYAFIRFDIGPFRGNSYQLFVLDEQERAWLVIADVGGNSDAIRDGPGEFTELSLGWDGEEFVGSAGDTELFRLDLSPDFAGLFGRAFGVVLARTGDGTGTALFDWVEATGYVLPSADAPRSLESALRAGDLRPGGER